MALLLRTAQATALILGEKADAAVLEAKIEPVWGWADPISDGTLRRGEVVWDRHALTCPHWEEAPASYWTPDGPQRLWRAH